MQVSSSQACTKAALKNTTRSEKTVEPWPVGRSEVDGSLDAMILL
jgi:hypothetical protein